MTNITGLNQLKKPRWRVKYQGDPRGATDLLY